MNPNPFQSFRDYATFNFLSYPVFRKSNQSGLAELVGEYKYANRVSLLYGRVIWVQVLQENCECLESCVWDIDLHEITSRLSYQLTH